MKDDYNTMPLSAHRLELTGRERLTVSGVEDVERFDETGIVMSTGAGMLVVTGDEPAHRQALPGRRRAPRGRPHRLHLLRGGWR